MSSHAKEQVAVKASEIVSPRVRFWANVAASGLSAVGFGASALLGEVIPAAVVSLILFVVFVLNSMVSVVAGIQPPSSPPRQQ